jgi:hypothetical protein
MSVAEPVRALPGAKMTGSLCTPQRREARANKLGLEKAKLYAYRSSGTNSGPESVRGGRGAITLQITPRGQSLRSIPKKYTHTRVAVSIGIENCDFCATVFSCNTTPGNRPPRVVPCGAGNSAQGPGAATRRFRPPFRWFCRMFGAHGLSSTSYLLVRGKKLEDQKVWLE